MAVGRTITRCGSIANVKRRRVIRLDDANLPGNHSKDVTTLARWSFWQARWYLRCPLMWCFHRPAKRTWPFRAPFGMHTVRSF